MSFPGGAASIVLFCNLYFHLNIRCGQLGHGNTGKETLPRKVMELMGTSVTAVAAVCVAHISTLLYCLTGFP